MPFTFKNMKSHYTKYHIVQKNKIYSCLLYKNIRFNYPQYTQKIYSEFFYIKNMRPHDRKCNFIYVYLKYISCLLYKNMRSHYTNITLHMIKK